MMFYYKYGDRFMNSIREKVYNIVDNGCFRELWSSLSTYNFLNFTDYDEKLRVARVNCGEKDSVITGIGIVAGYKCMIIAIEPMFMMGTMGVVAGEKIARAFRLATRKRLPVISFSASGGARIQEGIVSLCQMVKTSTAVYRHNKKRLLFISVICDPTLGGVTASFVSLADIIIGECGAHFGFTGKSIIEETTHEKLPEDFQTVEYAKRYGMVDVVVEKSEVKELLNRLIVVHQKKGVNFGCGKFLKNNSPL